MRRHCRTRRVERRHNICAAGKIRTLPTQSIKNETSTLPSRSININIKYVHPAHPKRQKHNTHPCVPHQIFLLFFPIFSLTSPRIRSIILNMYHNGLLCLFWQKCMAFIVQDIQKIRRSRAVLRGFCKSFRSPFVRLSSVLKKFSIRFFGAAARRAQNSAKTGTNNTAANAIV